MLLASQGNPFTEALLWLYRSHNLHSRVLDALKEDKSVAVGEHPLLLYYCRFYECTVGKTYPSVHARRALLVVASHDMNICVSFRAGGWSKDQFYTWSADYLRWLWYHEGDPQLPRMALAALKPLLEYDAEVSYLRLRQKSLLFVCYLLIPCGVIS